MLTRFSDSGTRSDLEVTCFDEPDRLHVFRDRILVSTKRNETYFSKKELSRFVGKETNRMLNEMMPEVQNRIRVVCEEVGEELPKKIVGKILSKELFSNRS